LSGCKKTPYTFRLDLISADQSCAHKLSLAEKARFVEIASQIFKGVRDCHLLPKKDSIERGTLEYIEFTKNP
jgi:hypothetical protein